MIWIVNIVLGLFPTLIFAGSIAAGVNDDRRHRMMFALVYGLWAITLAMWNWMRSAQWGWIVLWLTTGVIALGSVFVLLRTANREPRTTGS